MLLSFSDIENLLYSFVSWYHVLILFLGFIKYHKLTWYHNLSQVFIWDFQRFQNMHFDREKMSFKTAFSALKYYTMPLLYSTHRNLVSMPVSPKTGPKMISVYHIVLLPLYQLKNCQCKTNSCIKIGYMAQFKIVDLFKWNLNKYGKIAYILYWLNNNYSCILIITKSNHQK